jgi:hypothetical protein
MAKKLGVAKGYVVQLLAFSQLLLGDIRMDSSLPGVKEILASWDDAAS